MGRLYIYSMLRMINGKHGVRAAGSLWGQDGAGAQAPSRPSPANGGSMGRVRLQLEVSDSCC